MVTEPIAQWNVFFVVKPFEEALLVDLIQCHFVEDEEVDRRTAIKLARLRAFGCGLDRPPDSVSSRRRARRE